MKILGLHVRNTRNVGDRWSSPLDYLPFDGHEVAIADMRAPPAIDADLVIYGGGSIIAASDFGLSVGGARRKVAWGVGHHVRHQPWDEEMRAAHASAARSIDLYFPRDLIVGHKPWLGHGHVPCASCLHPAFDDAPAPARDVVRYSAARRVTVEEPADAPHMTNEDGTIEEAIAFLASARTVVTSSYHGVYWAGLLGREVRLVPWGSKFAYLPAMSLAEARAANRRAHAMVLDLIASAAT